MSTAIDIDVLKRAKAIQSPLVKELCTYIDELNAQLKAERDAYALLSDANADLSKENRGLRAELATALQDVKDARHDADQCLQAINDRDREPDTWCP